LNKAEIRKNEPKPEAQQGVLKNIANLPRIRLFPGKWQSAADIAEIAQLLYIIMKASFRNSGLRGNALVGRISGRHSGQHGIVIFHIPEFFAQQKVRFAKQRPEFIQHVFFDISFHRMCLLEKVQIEGDPATDEVR